MLIITLTMPNRHSGRGGLQAKGARDFADWIPRRWKDDPVGFHPQL